MDAISAAIESMSDVMPSADAQPNRPLAVDLCTGLHGWAEGLVSEGWRVRGYDVEDMCAQFGQPRPAHVELVIKSILDLHGSECADADLIVASPPCQFFSYCAMPWTRAKELAAAVRADPVKLERELALFNACFRIQREACAAAGRHIPMVVENVKGAQPWVGRARWAYGSFFLWGDVPALMPPTKPRAKVSDLDWNGFKNGDPDYKGQAFNPAAQGKALREQLAIKNTGGSWFNIGSPGQKETNRNPVHELAGTKNRDPDGYERDHPAAFGWKSPGTSSKGKARA